MKYCSQCGGIIKDETVFCNHCGKPVKKADGSIEATIPVQSLSTNSKPQKNNKTLFLVIAAICGILLVYSISTGNGIIPSMGVPNTPEGVTKAVMEAVVKKDLKTVQEYSYRDDTDDSAGIFGLAFVAMTDWSSDDKIRHYPTSYRLISKSSTRAEVNVYDQNNECFCIVKLRYTDGQWLVSYI